MTATSSSALDIPMVWSTLMARLTGTDPEYDAEIIRGFCIAFEIPHHIVMSKIKTHLGRSMVRH
jgi:hypothetical protein